MSTKIKVALADDHTMFLDGLASLFANNDEIEVSVLVNSGEALLSALKDHISDVVLTDINMPGIGGNEAASRILKEYPEKKIIVLSMHDTGPYIFPLIDLGIHGYLMKNADKSELFEAIRTVHAGKNYFCQPVRDLLRRREEMMEEEGIVLTRREREVLQYVYEGLATHEIADKLCISPFTVETHRRNLLSKTDTKNATQLVNKAISLGLVQMKTV